MSTSKIEQLICNKDFSYLRPYFYNNKFALRCSLGQENDPEYIKNALKRAFEIYDILFPQGANAIIFNYWIYDHSACSQFDSDDSLANDEISYTVKKESQQLEFLLNYQNQYRHVSVKNLPTYDSDAECNMTRRNRIVCFSDGKSFNYVDLIHRQINGENDHEISLVSFENECIMSVYDDRGCDIVFATHEKLKEFYPKLQPYFLEYDAEEMAQRYDG